MEINKFITYSLYEELLEKYSPNEIAEKLALHIGTVKRWSTIKEVPINYYNDLNALLDYKYESYESFRAKDQFFTSPEVAEYCYKKTLSIMKKLGLNEREYIFVEPSAGCCSFYNLLPVQRRIGIDIEPKGNLSNELIQSDYLKYLPNKNEKYVVIGNPPFGLRGNLALRFINHSAKFADIVAFILPPLFDSTGKGVPMGRVKGYNLIHTEKLPLDSYYYPNGTKVEIATIFQIWYKYGTINLANKEKIDLSNKIKIYSLSNGNTSSSKRNVNMINKCDVYLPSTCFQNMRAYDNFYDLPNKRGYGLVILEDKDNVKEKIMKLDWQNIAFKSTNSALNLRTDIILNALIDKEIIKE